MRLPQIIGAIFLSTLLSIQASFGQSSIKYSKKEKIVFENEIFKYKLSDNDTLVDIGAGDGIADELLFKFYPKMYFILEDIDPKVLRESVYSIKVDGQKKFFRENCKKILGYSDSIPLPSGRYKNILCRITLHEFGNPNKMLQEINRIMTRDGQFIIVERIPKFEGQVDKYCDKKLLSQSEIISMVTINGFKLVSSDSTQYQNDKYGGNAYILRFAK